jgi:hypothetical protein
MQATGFAHTSVCCLVSFAGILSPCFQSSDAGPSLFSGQLEHAYVYVADIHLSFVESSCCANASAIVEGVVYLVRRNRVMARICEVRGQRSSTWLLCFC